MSTIKEILESLSAKLEVIDKEVKQIDLDAKTRKEILLQKKSFFEEQIADLEIVVDSFQEPFNTLLALQTGGNITIADLKAFAETTGLAVDQKFVSHGPDYEKTG